MVGAVIISLFNKKKQPVNIPNPERKVSNPMDEVFPDFTSWLNETEEEEPIREEPIIQPKIVAKPVEAARYFTYENTGYQPIEKRAFNPESIETETEECYNGFLDGFDIRKAVVFSAILNPPVI